MAEPMLFGWLWAWPLALLALPLPLLAYWLLPPAAAAADPALKVPDPGRYAQPVAGATPDGRGWSGPLLLSVMWICLIVALARPQQVGDLLPLPESGRDLFLGIDISGSMRQPDLYAGNRRATRMAVVRQVASEFVSRRPGDRIGLIMFGSAAYVQTPLTLDHDTVQHFLGEAVVGLAGRSTAIGDAIGLGVKRLRERPDDSRVLILLTDGANSAGMVDPLDAARLAAQSNIRIHTIGVGADGGVGLFGMPTGGRSELDEKTLGSIAEITGGRYFRARNQAELQDIYREIDRLEPVAGEATAVRVLEERFVWPLALALALSVLWALTRVSSGSLVRPGAQRSPGAPGVQDAGA